MSVGSVAEAEAVAAQAQQLLTGFEALLRIEQAICRGAVAGHPAVAEGLALSGVRAASLSREPTAGAADGIALSRASCVHHVRGAPGREGAGAFELAATSVQEAIDDCLVAHLVSRRLGRPGVCSLAAPLAAGLSLARLPGPDQVAALLGGEGAAPEPEAKPDRIVEIAREALRLVGERSGQPADVVDLEGDDVAEVVLVAAGGDVPLVRDAARSLRDVGIPAAALAVRLVRPFPEEDVRRALSSARTAFVVTDASERSALLANVRAAADGATQVLSLPSASPARLLGSLAEQLPEAALDPEKAAPLPEPLRRRLIVAPAGPWGEETARQVAAALSHLGPLRVAPSTRRHLGATLLAWNGGETPGGKGDLLLAADPALLREQGTLALVRAGAALVVLSGASSSEELAALLDPAARWLLHERDLAVYRVPPPERDAESERATSFAMAGAALAALAGPDPAESHARSLEAAGQRRAAAWLREGALGVRRVERAALDPARHVQEVDFRAAPKLLRMPAAVDDPAQRERWSEQIRRFHRTGRAEFGPAPQLPMRPAALGSVAASIREIAPHPFVLIRSDEPDRPIAGSGLRALLAEGTARLQADGRPARVLADNTERLAIVAAQVLAQKAPGVRLGALLSEAAGALVELLGLSGEERGGLAEDLEALQRLLPKDALVLELRADTPLRIYLEVLDAARSPVRRRFAEELERLRERLSDLLRLDHLRSSEARSPGAIAAKLGGAGSEYLDPTALARTLAGPSGSEALDPERRRRIEQALGAIERHLDPDSGLPPVVLLHAPDVHPGAHQVESREHPIPLAAAVGVFDGLARRMADVLRAARVARLELSGAYRPELHDEPLAELDWEGFSAEELRLMPAVAVVTTGRSLREREQGPLSELLRSSRPVHVLVHDEVGAPDEAEDLSRFHLDLGYLVMAHREALAAGSTLARPDRLVEALVIAASALRPAVALVSLPAPDPLPRRVLMADAALQGRACPDFRYDPDAGSSWADRFDLGGNPQPERAWPLHRLPYLEDGAEQTLEVAFTFADAVALEPAYLRHLRTIPRAAWHDDQLPLAEYLERFEPEAGERGIPYIWVVDESDTLQRAIVTRELAMACGDRLRAWRVLQELAGYENVFARRAAEAARDEALREAEARRAELEQAHEEELERVRREGARQSMERLASALMSQDALSLGAPTPLPSTPGPRPAPLPEVAPVEPAAAAAPEPAVVEAPPAEEEALSFDEPYIDTPLCTTCNECTNLNSQLFQYNAEKQAFIADSAAGTFAELVKAAELCPARCIHPGKPRAGDATATPELIARAAPFNE